MKEQSNKALIAWACALSMLVGSHAAYAQATKITTSVPTQEITTFCMKMGMLRDANLPQFREKYNLEFDIINMEIAQIPVAVSHQDIALAECSGISTVMNAWNKGAKNLIIFAVGSRMPVYQLITSASIATLNDLKGKKIATPSLQSASTEAIEMILKRGANLLPSKDYYFVSAGAGSARLAALSIGAVNALATYPPDSYLLAKQGYKILADESDYVPQYVTGVHIVSREWAEKNKDALVRVIKGMIEVGQWLENPADKDDAIAWLSKNIHIAGAPLGNEYAADLYRFFITQQRLSFDGYAPESAVRANLDILKERGFLKDEEIPPLDQVFDFSYLNTALGELGLPTVAKYSANAH